MPPDMTKSFDPIWEDKYHEGHQQRAPWDSIVSFIYKYKPKNKKPEDINILEVGCGTASNLWFAALEGFNVTGIDASKSAIKTAAKRFSEYNLNGSLDVGDFTDLSFPNEQFDLAIDRAALCCSGTTSQKKAISEVHRVLKQGGKFLFTPYSDIHSSHKSGDKGLDGTTINIDKGTLTGVGQIRFIGLEDIENFFPKEKWEILSLRHDTRKDLLQKSYNVHASWNITVEKI